MSVMTSLLVIFGVRKSLGRGRKIFEPVRTFFALAEKILKTENYQPIAAKRSSKLRKKIDKAFEVLCIGLKHVFAEI